MTAETMQAGIRRRTRLYGLLAGAGALAAAVLVMVLGHPHPHAFDLALFERLPVPVQIHAGCATLALILGVVQLAGPKGTTVHRTLGWTWVLLMTLVAASSFLIHALNPGGFSPIHLLSLFVLFGLPMGVIAARQGRIDRHAGWMTGVFFFGLIVAGAFTFIPGRVMFRLLLG
jgi:uncharacterized membrane protein